MTNVLYFQFWPGSTAYQCYNQLAGPVKRQPCRLYAEGCSKSQGKLTLSQNHHLTYSTVNPVLSGHSNLFFYDRLSLNAGQKYCRMLQKSILQYFRPSLSYHLSLKPLFCLFFSGRLRQVLLYLDCVKWHD